MTRSNAYRCDRCGRTQRVWVGELRYYVVPWQEEGIDLFDRIPCHDEEGWCPRCGRLRPVEPIPSVDHLERMKQIVVQTGLSDWDREWVAQNGQNVQEVLRRRLTRFDQWIRWRKGRKSPPKCFSCGSAEAEPLQGGADGFLHPGCGGIFRVCDDTWHGTPIGAYLIPAEGPRCWGLHRLWEWIVRLQT
jgi:hypothetical protein